MLVLSTFQGFSFAHVSCLSWWIGNLVNLVNWIHLFFLKFFVLKSAKLSSLSIDDCLSVLCIVSSMHCCRLYYVKSVLWTPEYCVSVVRFRNLNVKSVGIIVIGAVERLRGILKNGVINMGCAALASQTQRTSMKLHRLRFESLSRLKTVVIIRFIVTSLDCSNER